MCHELLSIDVMLLCILVQCLIFHLQVMDLITESLLHTHLRIKRRHAVHTMKGMCERVRKKNSLVKVLCRNGKVGKAFRISTNRHTDGMEWSSVCKST